MKQRGGFWLPEADSYFGDIFERDGGYHLDHLAKAMEYVGVNRRRVAVDGGAHVGCWTRVLAQTFDRVHAFEPAFDTYECLIKNCAEFSNVEAANWALGDGPARVSVSDDFTRRGNTGARFINRGPAGGTIRMVALDELHLTPLDFLKLDLEGGEYHALMGARETLAFNRPVVLIEEKAGMSERFGVPRGSAAALLVEWGAREVERIGSDIVFAF